MCNEYDLAIQEVKAIINEWDEKKHKLQDLLNNTFSNKVFMTVKDCYKTPYSYSGTNFKNRKCHLVFSVDEHGIDCHPTFQNLRTKEYDMRIDYSYSTEHFELLEG